MIARTISLSLIVVGVILASLIAAGGGAEVLAQSRDAGAEAAESGAGVTGAGDGEGESGAAEASEGSIDVDAGETVADLFTAMRAGRWMAAVGLALMLLVAALRSVGVRVIPWLGTRLGGYALAFATAALVTLGTALTAGGELSLSLLGAALGAGFAAIGVHTAARDLTRTRS